MNPRRHSGFAKQRALFHFLIGSALLVLCARYTQAATFNIANGDVAGLIGAINTANSNSQDDTINLATNGDYVVTVQDNASNGLPVIGGDHGHNLTINGNRATIRRSSVSGTPEFRIFQMALSFVNSVTISNLTISNGYLSNGPGGAIILDDATTLFLTNCTISGNTAASGGGIDNVGVVTLTNCAIIGNTALPGSGGGRNGGGISNYGRFIPHGAKATVTLTNCTVSGNSAGTEGGGIWSSDNGDNPPFDDGTRAEVTVNSCTFSGNSSVNGGNDIFNDTFNGVAKVTVSNSIFNSANAALVEYANGGVVAITSNGYNLCSDNGSGFLTAAGDQINTNPKLDPAGPQYNGGPTQTIALTYGSPAIDTGNSFGLTTDQRGSPRPVVTSGVPPGNSGDGSDIGAYEAQSDPVQFGSPSFIVTTTNDHDDGVCGGGDCTLREAINRANFLGGTHTITFASGVTGTITLSGNAFDELSVTSNLTISGPGARTLAVSGNSTHRIFAFDASASCSISGLTIRDGKYAPSSDTTGEIHQGGAVFNFGSVAFNDCAFISNSVTGASNTFNGGFGGSGQGGAIYNHGGYLAFNRCTFSGNGATGAAGNTFSSGNLFGPGGNGGAGQGGAVFNNAAGTLMVTNCTFSGNTAMGGNGGPGNSSASGASGGNANGAAICNLGMMQIISATVSGNTGTGGTGAAYGFQGRGPNGSGNGGLSAQSGSSDTVANTLCAANSGTSAPDAEGAFNSSGYNLLGIGDQSSGFSGATSDQVGTTAAAINPQLGPLQNNGGPTDTMTPLGNSPAVDQGKSFGLTVDQRNHSRPFDEASIPNATDGTDIGAVETDAQLGPTLIVTTTSDHDDGTCTLSDCTLREALNAANTISGPNTITFAPGVTGTITLQAALGNLNITGDTTILGPGARMLAVSGNSVNRVFFISAGNTTISGLTIRDGLLSAPSQIMATGGAISNSATLTLSDCTVSNSHAAGGDDTGNFGGPGGTALGGGIYNSGTLTLSRCTLSGNGLMGGRGGMNSNPTGTGGTGGDAQGGAIYNSASLSINNCTFNGNVATGGVGGNGNRAGAGGKASGAIFNLGTLSVTATTFSGNTGAGGAPGIGSGGPIPAKGIGGIASSAGSSTLRDAISAGNTGNNGGGKDVDGAFTSGGYNLIGSGDHSAGFTNGTNQDQVGTDAALVNAQLGSLQNNGGPTDTLALLSNSPAINNGDPNAPSQDQRYYLRSGVPDIGAFEFGGALAPVSAVSRKTHGTAGTFDINLPLVGPIGIECRSGGATNDFQLVLTFPTPVTVNAAPQAQVTTGSGQVGTGGTPNGGVVTLDSSGKVVTVPLTSVTNAQRITITLFNVSDGVNTNSALALPMGILLGDVNSTARTDAGDVTAVRNKTVTIPDQSTCRFDVNASGRIDAGDVTATRNATVTVLP
jgi:fibronectin-binding autotransporter adhesin